MAFYVPTADQLSSLFPSYGNIQYLDKGGFKAVYTVERGGIKEALKLAHIPNPENVSEADRVEIIGEITKRVSREIGLLRDCICPYVVKLGSLDPIGVVIENTNYIAYSEEFIEGEQLSRIIGRGLRPPEPELRLLGKCLLSAIKEFWNNLKIVHRDIKPLNIEELTLNRFLRAGCGIDWELGNYA